MIAETASAQVGGDKANWIREILSVLPSQMPRVRALVWFDRDKETEWQFDSSPASGQAFRELASSPLFSGDVNDLLSPSDPEGSSVSTQAVSTETESGPEPLLRIHNASATVGHRAHALAFALHSSAPANRPVTAHYVVRRGAVRDLRDGAGKVTIPVGVRTKELKIWIDGLRPNVAQPQTRHIWIKLYGVSGAILAKPMGGGVIHYR